MLPIMSWRFNKKIEKEWGLVGQIGNINQYISPYRKIEADRCDTFSEDFRNPYKIRELS